MSTLNVSTINTATVNGSTGAADATVNGTLNGYVNTPGGTAFRNRIINGAMMIAQRGTSSATQGYSTVDRFYNNRVGGVAGLTMQQVYGPFSTNKYALRMWRDAGNTSTASLVVYQPIEGVNCRDIAGSTATISFLIGTGANVATSGHAIRLNYQTTTTDIGVSGSWTNISSVSFTVAASSAFVQKTATFTVPANATQLLLEISLACTGTAGADDSFYLTEIQLEKGSVATTFEVRPYGTELALCQRYYYRRSSVGTTDYIGNLQAFATTAVWGKVFDLPVQMRSSPVVNISSASHVFPYNSSGTASTAFTGVGAWGTSPYSVTQSGGFTGSSGLTAGNASVIAFNSTSGWIDASAEL